MSTHLAAFCVAKGLPLEVRTRATPKPGPGELLIAVKSIALNPADGLIRDLGLFIPTYPTVVGFDLSGLVLEVGKGVSTGTANGSQDISFQPGITRVAVYSAFFFRACDPDYGAFQERCIVPWQHAVPITDDKISWNHAATLPVSVQVPLMAWDAIEIPRVGSVDPQGGTPESSELSTSRGWRDESKDKPLREALLIWGASSSVGTMGVQSAKLLKQDDTSSIAAVYATAGVANMEYVTSLGADCVFDYKDPGVVDAIISAAKENDLVIRHCFLAMGQLELCQKVLSAFHSNDKEGGKKQAFIASAPMLPPDAKTVRGTEAIFLQPSTNEEVRSEQFRYWMGTWLRQNLAKGSIRPSPEPKVVGKGVRAINAGIDLLIQGVSCTKLVIEIDE